MKGVLFLLNLYVHLLLVKTEPDPSETDVSWADWSSWSQCNPTCDRGLQQRFRKCKVSTLEHECEGSNIQIRNCHTDCTKDEENDKDPKQRIVITHTETTVTNDTSNNNAQNDNNPLYPPNIEGQQHDHPTYRDPKENPSQGPDSAKPQRQGNSVPQESVKIQQDPGSVESVQQSSGSAQQGVESVPRVVVQLQQDGRPVQHDIGSGQQGGQHSYDPVHHDSAIYAHNNFQTNAGVHDISSTWGGWLPWGTCSKSCGIDGVHTRQRVCMGSERCVGNQEDYEHCNAVPCPGPFLQQYPPNPYPPREAFAQTQPDAFKGYNNLIVGVVTSCVCFSMVLLILLCTRIYEKKSHLKIERAEEYTQVNTQYPSAVGGASSVDSANTWGKINGVGHGNANRDSPMSCDKHSLRSEVIYEDVEYPNLLNESTVSKSAHSGKPESKCNSREVVNSPHVKNPPKGSSDQRKGYSNSINGDNNQLLSRESSKTNSSKVTGSTYLYSEKGSSFDGASDTLGDSGIHKSKKVPKRVNSKSESNTGTRTNEGSYMSDSLTSFDDYRSSVDKYGNTIHSTPLPSTPRAPGGAMRITGPTDVHSPSDGVNFLKLDTVRTRRVRTVSGSSGAFETAVEELEDEVGCQCNANYNIRLDLNEGCSESDVLENGTGAISSAGSEKDYHIHINFDEYDSYDK